MKLNLPFVNSIIKNTIFKQFVGGESLDETKPVVENLCHYGVNVILDYGVEGAEDEQSYDYATNEFLKVVNYAGPQKNIPFISIKITGIANFKLLEEIDSLMTQSGKIEITERYESALDSLDQNKKNEWGKVIERLNAICSAAYDHNLSILIDAEESWIQEPVDALCTLMMMKFNQDKVIIYNTVQLYRHDRLAFLKQSLDFAQKNNFILGAKLVRGAYMEKERDRAKQLNYLSPIQISKENTDKDYNAAIEFCIDQLDNIGLIIASHNEFSNLYTTQLLLKKNIAFNHKHIHFSQLYGMSDNITFNLAKAGCSVSKYLPFGPIKDVIPYLMRRAQENSSVSGQTGRELSLIKKEIIRRRRIS